MFTLFGYIFRKRTEKPPKFLPDDYCLPPNDGSTQRMLAKELKPGMVIENSTGKETVMCVMFPSYLPNRVQISTGKSDTLYMKEDTVVVVKQ